jgi:hypothetical protein
MRRSGWLVAPLAALLVAPWAIRAGGPFGGDDPGCIPDSKTAARCADGAGKALAKLIGSVVACHTKLANAAFKQAPFDEEACEQTDAKKSAHARFEASLAKLAACSDTPVLSAADAVARDLLAAAPAAGSLDTLAGAVYCDSTSGTALDPGGDDAGFVPADKGGLACAGAVAKGLAKLAGAVLTCHRKAAASGLKGGSTDDEPCETTARTKFDAGTTKLVAKGGCPACLDTESQGTLAATVVALAEQASGRLYPCSATTTTTSATTSTSPQTTTSTGGSTSSTTSASTTTSTPSSTSLATTTSTIASCNAATTHRPFSVSFAVADSSVIVQGLTLLVDYPEGQVTIPGSGNATSVRQSIINVQSGALSQPFDLDYALREQIAGTANPLTPGRLFTMNFLDCLGATPPTAADFTCTVEVATDPLGLQDQGVTCTVSAG